MKSIKVRPIKNTRKGRRSFRIALLSVFVFGVATAGILLPDAMQRFNDSSSVSAAGTDRVSYEPTAVESAPMTLPVAKSAPKKARKTKKRKLPDLVKIEEQELKEKREEMNRQLRGKGIPLSDEAKKSLAELDDEDGNDPDLPRRTGRVKVDKELYLQMRE